jgi:cytoskeletal protein RodZ
MKTKARPAAEDQNRPRPGQILRAARQERGLSLDDAERGTRIRREFLEALEADDYERLPPPVYTRGFIRSYARWLGLDPDQVVSLFPQRA